MSALFDFCYLIMSLIKKHNLKMIKYDTTENESEEYPSHA
jgi:hypothetical protein